MRQCRQDSYCDYLDRRTYPLRGWLSVRRGLIEVTANASVAIDLQSAGSSRRIGDTSRRRATSR